MNRLEHRLHSEADVPPLLIQVPLENAERILAPGERFVVDTIRWNSLLTEAHERITADPRDNGRLLRE